MYSSFQLAKKYLRYYLTAANGKGHGTHSPFVYQFIKKVLNDKKQLNSLKAVEALRKQLLKNNQQLEVEDFGAGSRRSSTQKRSIKTIARNAAKPKKYSRLLYRMAAYYKPETILELGTSLGMTSAYLYLAQPAATVITIEGSAAIHEQAKQNFAQLGLKNIKAIQGNFDAVLPAVLQQYPVIDLAYIDGNHRLEPTLRYFQLLSNHITEESILVFDDIHWSEEMERAWSQIKEEPSVTATIDLFFIGIVFFRKDFKQKQHFTIRY